MKWNYDQGKCAFVRVWVMIMRYTTWGVNYSNDESLKQLFKVSDQAENEPKS